MSYSKTLVFALILIYPLIVYFGLEHFDVRVVALVIVVLAVLRLILIRRVVGCDGNGILPRSAVVFLVCILLAIGAWVAVSEAADVLLYYPVLVNAVFLSVFFWSLVEPPSIVERIARIQSPELPAAGVRYTRKVTMVWCVFFVANGFVALLSALSADLKFWAIYNSGGSYCLMGMLFVGEYLVRRRVQRNVHGSASRGWS